MVMLVHQRVSQIYLGLLGTSTLTRGKPRDLDNSILELSDCDTQSIDSVPGTWNTGNGEVLTIRNGGI